MANQIAAFFAPYPEADAVDGVLEHLEKFWDPAMRKGLIEIAAQDSDDAGTPADGLRATLHPLALSAAARLRVPRSA
jgi:formate dehydrogenase subunit delta